VEAQAESVTTPVPSRFSTVSLRGSSVRWAHPRQTRAMAYRVLQAPEMVTQCGNRSLLYPVPLPEEATVMAESWDLAVASEGMPP
jgi:hypothetical protein